MGNDPDRVRLDAKSVAAFLNGFRPKCIIVEGLNAKTIERMHSFCENISLVAALPQVFFEDEIPRIKALVKHCAEEDIAVEVNSWGGWLLAKAAKAKMEAGPGLPVLNSLAARMLFDKGMKSVTLSPEPTAGSSKNSLPIVQCPARWSSLDAPPLLTTRVEVPERFLGKC